MNRRKSLAVISAGVILSAALVGCGAANSANQNSTGTTTGASAPARTTPTGGGATTGGQPPTIDQRTSREIDQPCPYANNDEFRDAEGDRVGRSVQLAGNPVGCRFYFQYDPKVIVGEIRIHPMANSTLAFNAVVNAHKTHPEFVEDKTIGDFGAISIRLPLQGEQTWATLFSKGRYMVTVQSRQTDVAQDSRNLAVLIYPRIPGDGH